MFLYIVHVATIIIIPIIMFTVHVLILQSVLRVYVDNLEAKTVMISVRMKQLHCINIVL